MEGTNRYDVIKIDVENLHKYLEHALASNNEELIRKIEEKLDAYRSFLLDQ